jgi:hypothetical protein
MMQFEPVASGRLQEVTMRSRFKFSSILLALLLAAFALSGCEASVGTETNQQRLEKAIKAQLAGKIANQVDSPMVAGVKCVEGETNKFDCVAKVGYKVDGHPKTGELAIDGKCDSDSCNWKTRD